LRRYINEVADFREAVRRPVRIDAGEVKARALVLAIPAGSETKAQRKALSWAKEYAGDHDVKFTERQVAGVRVSAGGSVEVCDDPAAPAPGSWWLRAPLSWQPAGNGQRVLRPRLPRVGEHAPGVVVLPGQPERVLPPAVGVPGNRAVRTGRPVAQTRSMPVPRFPSARSPLAAPLSSGHSPLVAAAPLPSARSPFVFASACAGEPGCAVGAGEHASRSSHRTHRHERHRVGVRVSQRDDEVLIYGRFGVAARRSGPPSAGDTDGQKPEDHSAECCAARWRPRGLAEAIASGFAIRSDLRRLRAIRLVSALSLQKTRTQS